MYNTYTEASTFPPRGHEKKTNSTQISPISLQRSK